MTELENKIKTLIVDTLHLEDVTPEDIETDAPLFGDGLGLDSIDALELGIALKKEFGLELAVGDPSIKAHFKSVATLAALVSGLNKA
ncbi:MAG: phosphopantetheine-binding protein [Betaproteobacteria bacterium]